MVLNGAQIHRTNNTVVHYIFIVIGRKFVQFGSTILHGPTVSPWIYKRVVLIFVKRIDRTLFGSLNYRNVVFCFFFLFIHSEFIAKLMKKSRFDDPKPKARFSVFSYSVNGYSTYDCFSHFFVIQNHSVSGAYLKGPNSSFVRESENKLN